MYQIKVMPVNQAMTLLDGHHIQPLLQAAQDSEPLSITIAVCWA
jgi:hypothetical protein